MSKDIPEIDDLTRGINDSELILTQDSVETQVEQKENNNEAQEKDTAVSLSDTGCWDDSIIRSVHCLVKKKGTS